MLKFFKGYNTTRFILRFLIIKFNLNLEDNKLIKIALIPFYEPSSFFEPLKYDCFKDKINALIIFLKLPLILQIK